MSRSVALAESHDLLGRALLFAWYHGLVPAPEGRGSATLSDGRVLDCLLSDHTQRSMLLEQFEPRETRLVRELLPRGGAFVDVGAHIGWFTVVGARAVGPGGNVHAFEAFGPNVAALRRNLALNGLERVDVTEAAVADAPGRARMGREAGGDSGTATAGAQASGSLEEVEQVTLDSVLPASQPIDLLKVDVEGFEARVLAGASASLGRTTAVLIELNRAALEANGSSPEEVAGVLAHAGLERQRVLTRRPGAVQPGFRPLARRADPRALPDYGNLLARRD
jgi:FkbM family methyltransferase